MPELPEAITISSQISPFISGKKLKSVTIKKGSIVKNAEMLSNLINSECIEVGNYGKMIYFKFPGYWIVFMLALTGYLVINPREELYRYSIVEFKFEDDNIVVFGAKRMFEKMIVFNFYPFEKYGPDFRNISPLDFIKGMVKVKKYIKVALMDQKVLAGIGNIYACESLFDSGISPTRYTYNTTAQEYHKLYKSLRSIIDLAIKKRGSTVNDYIDAFGNPGEYQNFHKVYGRKICPVCSSKIKITKIMGRITYFCPNCQK